MLLKNSAQYSISMNLFVRFIGVIYAIAFLSLWIQYKGLFGSDGIYPLSEYLQAIEIHLEANTDKLPFLAAPSIFWFSSSDFFIHCIFAISLLSSILIILGILPLWASIICWMSYLSFCNAVPVFLNFQWDTLLLEVGFLTIFICNRGWIYKNPNPSPIIRILIYYLLFRLMFQSFLLKYLSFDSDGSNTWRDLTALNYHFFTQPIPHEMSWFFHQLPDWILAIAVVFMFMIQGILPFFAFANRWCKYVAFLGFISFMLTIMASGNYGFFNLLAIALCIPLLDNKLFENRLGQIIFRLKNKSISEKPRFQSTQLIFHASLAAFILFITYFDFLTIIKGQSGKPEWFASINAFRSINSYGLFRVMTKERPEIIIEFSDDSKNWEILEFKHKISKEDTIAKFVNPHLPRLDWQMWFAALQFKASGQFPEWFFRFIREVASNNEDVHSLLKSYPDEKFKYFRIRLSHFEFSKYIDKDYFGHWWSIKELPRYNLVIEKDKLLGTVNSG